MFDMNPRRRRRDLAITQEVMDAWQKRIDADPGLKANPDALLQIAIDVVSAHMDLTLVDIDRIGTKYLKPAISRMQRHDQE